MTRLSTNGRLSYTPVHRETPIEGIGGMYRFWKSIDSKDRDKLVELFEFGHQDPGEDASGTSRMDWESLAEQQKDAYENGYDGPIELMNQGWDYAIDDALNRKVQSATDRLIHRVGDTNTDSETGPDELPSTNDTPETADNPPKDMYSLNNADLKGTLKQRGPATKAARAHARAYDWRVNTGNDDRWRAPLIRGNKWPTAPTENYFDPDEYSRALAQSAQVSQGHTRRLY